MPGIFATLNTSVKALSAHSRSLEIAGKNLANVNNADYSRQRVVYGDRGTVLTTTGAESLGLEAVAVQQLRDEQLDRQVGREIALKSGYEAEQSAYQRAQAGLGQGIDRAAASSATGAAGDKGLSLAIDDFFNSFQGFATSPTDDGARLAVLQKAGVLSDRFRAVDQRVSQVQDDLDRQISTDIGEVNRLLGAIADLNGQIGRFEINLPGSAVDMRDQRQARLEELAAKLPIEIRSRNASQLDVYMRDGAGNEVLLVDLATVPQTVAYNGNQVTAGAPPVALSVASGSIQGALAAKLGPLQVLRDDLDALARQMIGSVNAAYNPTGATGDFFDAAGTGSATLRLAAGLTAGNLKASDGGAAGDNALALAVAQLGSRRFSTTGGDDIDGTFAGFYGASVVKLGQALADANARVDDQTNIERLVRSQRDAVSGVSLDEEMADLMKYQRAFQASSRVFSVMDELLDTLVNQLGR